LFLREILWHNMFWTCSQTDRYENADFYKILMRCSNFLHTNVFLSFFVIIECFYSSEFDVVDELFGSLRERNWLHVEISDSFVFARDDKIKLVFNDFLHVEELPIVEILSDLECPVVVEESKFRWSAS